MGDLDPHVYAVAEEAFKKMERYALTMHEGAYLNKMGGFPSKGF